MTTMGIAGGSGPVTATKKAYWEALYSQHKNAAGAGGHTYVNTFWRKGEHGHRGRDYGGRASRGRDGAEVTEEEVQKGRQVRKEEETALEKEQQDRKMVYECKRHMWCCSVAYVRILRLALYFVYTALHA